MIRSIEALQGRYGETGLIPVKFAATLFESAEEDFSNPTVPTIQISHTTGLRVPNAEEAYSVLYDMRGSIDTSKPEYLAQACSTDPMTFPELQRFGTIHTAQPESVGRTLAHMIADSTLQITDTIVYFDRRIKTDPNHLFFKATTPGLTALQQEKGIPTRQPKGLMRA